MRLAQELNGNIAPLFPGSSPAFVTYCTEVCNKTVCNKNWEEPWERCYCDGVLSVCTMLQYIDDADTRNGG